MGRLKILVERRPRVVLTLATLALLLPFSGKAFHMDDPLFIWTGRQMRAHPFNPYGFDVNWYGSVMPMAQVTRNPPLASGYIALLSSIFGEREFCLHIGFLAQALGAVLGTYALGRRFCKQPFFAALATLLTPVFLVSSTTLMCDVLMLALWIWATVWWLRALDKNEPLAFTLAGLLLGACGLTKYFGVALLPLLFAYSLFKTERLGWWLVYFLIPIAIFALYEWWTRSLYGNRLLSDAAIYATRIGSHQGTPFLLELLTALAFVGGCFVIVLIFTPFLWPAKVWMGIGAGILVFLAITRTQLPFAVYCQGVILIAGGIGVIALSLLDFRRQPDACSLLLGLWVLGTFLFCFLNWTVNGRSLLPMTPAVAILLWRRMENNAWSNECRYVGLAFAAAALISLLVTRADYQLANTARTAAAEVRQTLGKSSPIWFQGHWGFQYYAEAQGLTAFDNTYSRIKPGDLMVIPTDNTNVLNVPSDRTESVGVIREIPCPWLSTMDVALGAGFYSDRWGRLPFVFGPARAQEYRLVRFK